MKVSISFLEKFGMHLRKTPVSLIVNNYKKAIESGLDITPQQLEAHYLSGGNVENLIDAMILAKKINIETTISQLIAIELSGNNPVDVIKDCEVKKEFVFNKYSKNALDIICGYCKDRTAVSCECKVIYNLTPNDIWGNRLDLLQMHLSARIAVYINTSDSLHKIKIDSSKHEAQLLSIAIEIMQGVKEIKLNYTKT